MWKILNNYDDADENTWFQRPSNLTSQTTRSTTDNLRLRKPAYNTEQRRHFFSVRVCDKWNGIPYDIRAESKLSTFKIKLDEWTKSHE